MPPTFKPKYPVQSYLTIYMERSNPFEWSYSLGRGKKFPFGTNAYLTFQNTYTQVLAVWEADASTGDLLFFAEAADADAIPDGTAWKLTVDLNDGNSPRVFAQGNVIRVEAPFPDDPSQSNEFDNVQYGYSFGSPGLIVDPAWRILNGHPRVYDNSGASLPNAVAAGSLQGGDLAIFDDVAMLYYAPLNNDPVRLTYNVVRGQAVIGGEAWIVICSNYDMTNSAAIYHRQGIGQDVSGIATGTGPVTYQVRKQIAHATTSLDNYTAEYNPSSNTFNLYMGNSTTPLVSWEDTTEVVNHGLGERYVGFAFKSAFLSPGIEVSDWIISDSV